MKIEEVITEMRSGNAQHIEWADVVEEEIERLQVVIKKAKTAMDELDDAAAYRILVYALTAQEVNPCRALPKGWGQTREEMEKEIEQLRIELNSANKAAERWYTVYNNLWRVFNQVHADRDNLRAILAEKTDNV